MHLHRLHLSGQVGGGKCDDHPRFQDTSLNTTDGHSSNTWERTGEVLLVHSSVILKYNNLCLYRVWLIWSVFFWSHFLEFDHFWPISIQMNVGQTKTWVSSYQAWAWSIMWVLWRCWNLNPLPEWMCWQIIEGWVSNMTHHSRVYGFISAIHLDTVDPSEADQVSKYTSLCFWFDFVTISLHVFLDLGILIFTVQRGKITVVHKYYVLKPFLRSDHCLHHLFDIYLVN